MRVGRARTARAAEADRSRRSSGGAGGVTGAALAALLVGVSLTACSGPASAGRCVDFISLPTPHQRYDAADIVVVATLRTTDRTVDAFATYPVHRATTITRVKGAAPSRFDVIAPSDQCERRGEPVAYLEGDPLARVDRAVLYLVEEDGHWRLITPSSIDPLPRGSALPFATPTPTPAG